MCNSVKCAEFFKNQRVYDRCFAELRKKWKSYGKVAGNIVLKEASVEERRAIGGIIGKTFWKEDIKFSFSEFEEGLQKTRYAPVDMKVVLESYFEETLSTNQERKQEEKERRKDFFERLCVSLAEQAGKDSAVISWIKSVADTKMQGYQLLMKEFGKNQTQAENLAKNVGNALIKLEMEDGIERPLAVFAAEVSGNPHYFDRGTIAGQLLLNGICYCHRREMPQSADEWRRLLLCVGIVPDNVSSIVHAYGLRLQTADGYHPAYDAFCKLSEPYVITLENLKGVTGVCATGQRVYIVENEMVFTFLVNHLKKNKVTLLCTSGQLRTAALELIPLIIGSGAEIYYSGDLDPEGIDIADRLWQKFDEKIQVWRMTSRDYLRSCSGESITDVRLVKLDRVKNPVLRETAKRVREKGVCAYQENILDDLLKDIGENVLTSPPERSTIFL